MTRFDERRNDGKPSGWGRLQPKSITESGIEGIASRHGYRVEQLPLSLFDLTSDPGETKNVAGEHADVVARIRQLAEPARAELGDKLTGRTGGGVRPAGRIDEIGPLRGPSQP